VQGLEERIARYMSPPLFPVHLDDIPSEISFHDAPEVEVTIGSATVRASKVTHQGPTVGYRIEEHGHAFVYLPDHEPSIGNDLRAVSPDWMSGYDLARGADVLLHDAQYHDHEYLAHAGWGHSSITDTMEFASKADVERVVLFHHDPYHDDDDLEELLTEARAKWSGPDEHVQLASERMTIVFDESGVEILDPA
jgi:ribonuclease BN (tRNA processing enzyme)